MISRASCIAMATAAIGMAAGMIVAAPAFALDARTLVEGTRLVRAGDHGAAAAVWLEAADATVDAARDPGALRDGCLLYVLAALAWEQAGDPRTWASWGRAVQCYAATGTTWETERARLAGRLHRADEGLRAFAAREGAAGRLREDTERDAELWALAALVPLATYTGPALRPPTSAAEAPAAVVPLAGPQTPGPASTNRDPRRQP